MGAWSCSGRAVGVLSLSGGVGAVPTSVRNGSSEVGAGGEIGVDEDRGDRADDVEEEEAAFP